MEANGEKKPFEFLLSEGSVTHPGCWYVPRHTLAEWLTGSTNLCLIVMEVQDQDIVRFLFDEEPASRLIVNLLASAVWLVIC